MRELDEIGGVRRGKLDESGQAGLALGEGGPRFGIEAEDRFFPELFESAVQSDFVLYDDDRPVPGLYGQKIDVFFA